MRKSEHRIEVFDASLQKTYFLLDDIARDLGWEGLPHQSYSALRAVLRTLRDRLPLEEAVHFGAQLPMLVRGLYYDGWKPMRVPNKMRRDAFLAAIREQFQPFLTSIFPQTIDQVVEVVLDNIAQHIDPGEMRHLQNVLPKDMQELMPQMRTSRGKEIRKRKIL